MMLVGWMLHLLHFSRLGRVFHGVPYRIDVGLVVEGCCDELLRCQGASMDRRFTSHVQWTKL